MNQDPWRQWQAFANFAPWGWPAGTGAAPSNSSASPGGFGGFADSAERFAAAVREYFDRLHPPANAAAGASSSGHEAASALGQFLRDHFAGLVQPPWVTMGPAGSNTAFTEAPALGPGREHWLRAQRALEAWNRMIEAQARLQRMWGDTLREAAVDFTSRLDPGPATPLSVETIERLYDRWIDCAEEAYARTAHGEAFCRALADYLNAAGRWRSEFATEIEDWAKRFDLPSRSEINTLESRLRELEAQLAAVEASRIDRAAAAAPTSRAPRRPRRKR